MSFHCVGCGHLHVIYIKGFNLSWDWNGSLECPTVKPLLLNTWNEKEVPKVCHLFITNAQIIYCGDSTHRLAGQTVDMVEMK